MAAYSATVVSPMKGAERISRSLGLYAGKCAIENYNQTLARITAITKYFKPTSNATAGGFAHGIISVDIVNPSALGYLANWDYTTGCFKCFYVDKSTSPTGILPVTSGTSAGGALYYTTGGGVTAITASVGPAITINALVAAAAAELADDINAGTFGFIAIGLI